MIKKKKDLDLTIIIPTSGRQFIIESLAEFYINKPYKVVILDGSKKPLKFNFPSNVNYIWSGESYLERLQNSIRSGFDKQLLNHETIADVNDIEFYNHLTHLIIHSFFQLMLHCFVFQIVVVQTWGLS